jgi:hypothetical protein
MAALRQIAERAPEISAANAYLFHPGETFATIQGGMNGTPIPHEDPQLSNPPGGVLVYYWLKSAASGPVKLELVDSNGAVRACAASDMNVPAVNMEALNVQAIWMQPAPPPSAAAGMHRYALGAPSARGFGAASGSGRGATPAPSGACAGSAPRESTDQQPGRRSPERLQPGSYTVRMTVNGQTYTEHVAIKPDPRLATPGNH